MQIGGRPTIARNDDLPDSIRGLPLIYREVVSVGEFYDGLPDDYALFERTPRK
jgi:hypothetical protein